MGNKRTLRASTLMAFISSGAGYAFIPRTWPTARAFQGYRRCNISPFNSHRWRSSPVPARLCAIAVDRDTQGHGHGYPNNQHNAACGIPYRDPPPDEDLSAAAATELSVAETTSERRYGVTDGDAEGCDSESNAIPEDSTPPVSASETALEMGLDEGITPIPREVEEERKRANEEMLRWGRSVKQKFPARRSESTFSPIVTDKHSDATMGTVCRPEVPDIRRINGAPNNRLPENQTVEIGIAATSEAQTGSLAGDFERDIDAAGSVAATKPEEETKVGEGMVRGKGEVSVSTASRVSLGRRWKKRVTFVVRTAQIWAFLLHVLLKLLRQKLVQKDEVRMSARRRKLGKYLCKAFLKLGPTFIKIGQLLSTRVDLLSTEYIEELRQLQDDVPGFGGKKAVEIIERELGAPVWELFDSFNSTPLAAASLGQVHEAWLDGERYAVKVQRPGLEDLFQVDLTNIGALASVLDRFDPKLDGASRDWGAIFRESKRVLYEEVDYTREGANAERFSKIFKGTEWIKVPRINWSRSTSKVLCMEFLQGIKITDLGKIDEAGIDRPLLATRIAECYLAQLCRHGFFHCDPHPGNLACDAFGGGRIIFYDFGMMDELSDYLKREFVNLLFGIYGNDVKEVVDALEAMDIIRKGADRLTVERIARFYLEEFQSTLTKGGKYINQLNAEEEKALVRRERAKIGQDLFSGGASVPLQFPASFTFVFRAFTTLDGIGKTLDPVYDLTRIASPYLKALLDLKDGSAYMSVLKTWQKRLGWRGQDVASVVQSPRRVKHVNDVVTQLETGDLRLRVRVLEAEEAFARIEAVQESLTAAVMATLFLNAGVFLSGMATAPALIGSRALFTLAGFFGVQIPVGYFKVWRLKNQAENTKGFR